MDAKLISTCFSVVLSCVQRLNENNPNFDFFNVLWRIGWFETKFIEALKQNTNVQNQVILNCIFFLTSCNFINTMRSVWQGGFGINLCQCTKTTSPDLNSKAIIYPKLLLTLQEMKLSSLFSFLPLIIWRTILVEPPLRLRIWWTRCCSWKKWKNEQLKVLKGQLMK